MARSSLKTHVAAAALACAGVLGCHDPSSPASFLVQGETGINGIAVDASHVYFIRRDGHLKSVPVGGGQVVELVSGIDNPVEIALDKDNVYWTTSGGTVGSVPKAGGNPASLVDGRPNLVGLAVGPDDVFYTTGNPDPQSADKDKDHVERKPKAGGSPITLSEGGYALGFNGADFLYTLTGKGELLGVPAQGGSPVSMADQASGTTSIAADESFVYWVNPNPPGADPASTAPRGQVLRVRPDGMDPLVIAMNQQDPFRVAADGKNVYWTSKRGSVSMAPVDGNADPVVMSTGAAGEVYVAVDDTTIYWARSEGGTITALPKSQDQSQ
jgi:hypothetical protein